MDEHKHEDQDSTTEWGKRMFPAHDGFHNRRYAVKMVLEEALELCLAEGLTSTEINAVLDTVDNRFKNERPQVNFESQKEEAADVLITLYYYAEEAIFDLHDAVDEKMVKNRSRPKSYYDEKTERKKALR